MGMCADVGIQAESHAGHLTFCGSQFIDDFQFGDALHVETEDIVVQSEIDLPVGLAYTCIDHLIVGEPGLDACFYLTTADAVGSHAGFTYQTEHLRIGIGLDGVVHHKTLMLASLLVDGAQRLAQHLRIVVVEGRLYRLHLLYGEFSFAHN